jgi:DNA-binding NarL/FixJ family response regulator
MTSAPEIKVPAVERWYQAYSDRDIDGMIQVAHPEIEIVPVAPLLTKMPGTTFRGHEGVRTLALWTYETYPRLYVESCEARFVRGLVMASVSFVVDDQVTPVFKRHTDSLFDLEGDLIRRTRAYLKQSDALEAAEAGSVLTPREREIFQLLAVGLSAPQIADRLYLSPATVRTHVQNGVTRLGAKTRVQAVSMALKRGEIQT